MSDCLCDQCAALCCRYFALPIDNPRSARQFDDIRWYLLHENVVVFVEKKQWYVGIMSRCKHLQGDNRCGIYETRPHICRNYVTDNCDYHGGEYDFELMFTSAEQLRRYALEKLKKSGRWKPRKSDVDLLGAGHPRSPAAAPRVMSLPILKAMPRHGQVRHDNGAVKATGSPRRRRAAAR